MKQSTVNIEAPKSRSAALNQSVFFLDQLDRYNKKKENIMKNQALTILKIEKLKTVLDEYSNQIQLLEVGEKDFEGKLQALKSSFNLTESEILELRSQLLRVEIAELQKKAGITQTDGVTLS